MWDFPTCVFLYFKFTEELKMTKNQITISYSRFKGKQVYDCINFITLKSLKTFKHIKTKIFLTTDSKIFNMFDYLYNESSLF